MSITLGIIGAGTIGEVHAKAAAEAGTQVARIADLDLKAAKKLAEKHEGSIASDNIQELLADKIESTLWWLQCPIVGTKT